jgi:hypothetical protein
MDSFVIILLLHEGAVGERWRWARQTIKDTMK